ncbi:Fur family transcriptional regulator [Hymenobacter lapidiphilus]|uniref:Transcriptional repressor n=1 Tax=Hymenobacter lapidiphilus TaxID=2608003 RepID=A0A7Y7PQ40_9BACT|nr:transcriptional repressor [Hymenobacter lapidiphilus]NVO31976.1 transcriptional repressor [Hymenobacter lapidiphilus]
MPTAADRLVRTLSQHGLRQTPVRRSVLQVLADAAFALSGSEIEQQLPAGTDRITLYRTLKSFEESGLIHRVIDSTDVVRYAACSIECSAKAHFDNHVHFKCTICQHIYCLNQVAIPAVTLPAQFQVVSRDYLLAGVCRECQPAV